LAPKRAKLAPSLLLKNCPQGTLFGFKANEFILFTNLVRLTKLVFSREFGLNGFIESTPAVQRKPARIREEGEGLRRAELVRRLAAKKKWREKNEICKNGQTKETGEE
jgi:hypothetical protein